MDYYGRTPMRDSKTACFEALVLELDFAQMLRCFLGWRSSPQASSYFKILTSRLQCSAIFPPSLIFHSSSESATHTGINFRYGDLLKVVAKMLASPVPHLSNVGL